MAAASAGRVRDVHTLGEAYCNLILACTAAGEWERAMEWCELVDEFARGHEVTPLLGACRTVHADVLLATGRWPEAERALETALAVHARYVPEMGAPTVAAMAELRVRQGRLAGGRAAARRPRGAPVVAARARPAAHRAGPAAGGRRAAPARADGGGGRCDAGHAAAGAARRRPPGVRGCRGRRGGRAPARASSRATRAPAWSRRAPTWPRRAWRSRPDARARPPSRRAGRSPRSAGSRCRSTWARRGSSSPVRWPSDAPDLARDEARTAFAAFRELGASRAMDGAAAVLRDLGAGTAGRPRSYGELTAREQEVLGLIGAGDVERADRPDAVHQREDGRPPRQPHPLEARRAQPAHEAAAHAARRPSGQRPRPARRRTSRGHRV